MRTRALQIVYVPCLLVTIGALVDVLKILQLDHSSAGFGTQHFWTALVIVSFITGWISAAMALLATSHGDRLKLWLLRQGRRRAGVNRTVQGATAEVGTCYHEEESPYPQATTAARERARYADLAVVTYYCNPSGSSDLRVAYVSLMGQMKALGLDTFSVEVLFPGDSPPTDGAFHQITADETNHLWQKEVLVNTVVALLPEKYRVVAWFDPGVVLLNSAWVDQALDALDKVSVLQPFEQVLLINHDGHVCSVEPSAGLAMAGGTSNVRAHGFAGCRESYGWYEGAWVAKRSVFPLCTELSGLGAGELIVRGWCGIGLSLQERLPNRAYLSSYDAWATDAYRKAGGRIGYLKGQAIVQLAATPVALRSNAAIPQSGASPRDFATLALTQQSDGLLAYHPDVADHIRSLLAEMCSTELHTGIEEWGHKLPTEFRCSVAAADA
jgi:hypothetical protein